MRLDQLRIFAAVADTLKISSAADRVNRSPSAVSEGLRELEASLGVDLVDRARRQWQLTAAGDRLLPYARSMLATADEARIEVTRAGEAQGKLAIGSLETLASTVLPSLLERYASAYPRVTTSLTVSNSAGLIASVGRGDLDIAVVLGRSGGGGLLTRVVARQRLQLALPRAHRLAARRTVSANELFDVPFLVTELGCVFRALFDDTFGAEDKHPPIVAEIGSIAALHAMVARGQGAALLPECAIDPAAVVQVALAVDLPPVPVTAIWRRRPRQRPELNAFLACCPDD